jgi:hypothetical protein
MTCRFILPMSKLASCVGVCLLLAIIAIQPGCKRSTTTVVGPKGEKTTITTDGEGTEVEFKSGDGQDVRYAGGKKGVSLPADFPADAPAYPKATVIMSATGGKEITVAFTVTDPAEKVVAFYKAQVREKGWDVKNSTEMSQLTMLDAEKNGRKLTVLISSEKPDQTSINLVVSKEK